MYLNDVLKKPLLTEKTTKLAEKSNRYGFWVNPLANKAHIKMAVEKFYDVKVLNVKTVVMPGERKRAGYKLVKKSKAKKAYVKLADGQKIEFFKDI